MTQKKYASVRWRVDGKHNLYVYNENDLLFTRSEVYEADDDSVSEIIDEELGDDTWLYAYEHDADDDVDDDSDEKEEEDDDTDTSLSDGIPEISSLSDGILNDKEE